MKHIGTLALVLASVSSQAQLITLTDEQGVAVNSTAIHYWGTADEAMGVPLNCTLHSGSAKVINMKRYELELPQGGGTMNNYCWGKCYNPTASGTYPVWLAPVTQTLYPEEEFVGFHAYYSPTGQLGVARFLYVWFDDNNPTDSVWTEIDFHSTSVGMDEVGAVMDHFDVAPVPSAGGDVQLSFTAPVAGHQAVIEFHDALGQLASRKQLRNGQQRLVMHDGELSTGVWFATILLDGRVVATKRLVITGH